MLEYSFWHPPSLLLTALVAIAYFLWLILLRQAVIPRNSLSDLPGPPRESWWQGNIGQLVNPRAWEFHRDIMKYRNAVRIHGLFGDELLYTFNPRALHHILIKDQEIFEEAPFAIAFNLIAFGRGLMSTLGADHRRQRKMLNPVFSVKHMRGLAEVLCPIAHLLSDKIEDEVRSGKSEVNIMGWFSRAGLDFIGQGALGYSFESLETNKSNAYGDAVKMFFPVLAELGKSIRLLPFLVKIGPAWLRRLIVDLLPFQPVQQMKNIVDIMQKTSEDIISQKRQALRNGEENTVKQVGIGRDIMSILLRANMEATENERLSEEELIGQMSLFIFAGHDTTTSALTRILWILSHNSEAQGRLRQEVTKARGDNHNLDYDTVMSLPFLDAVCRETLRLHPPVSFFERVMRKETVLPLSVPENLKNDRQPIKEIYLRNNTKVVVSIIAANTSKDIWGEDAEQWKPER